MPIPDFHAQQKEFYTSVSCDLKFAIELNKIFQIKLSKILNIQLFHFDSNLE